MPSPDQTRATLERAVTTLTRKPSIGQRVYTSTAHIASGTTCVVAEKDKSLMADIPLSMGGDDAGPSPSMLLRASVTSCVAIGIKMWAARKQLPLGPVTVTLETGVDARGQFGICENIPPGFTSMRLKITAHSAAPAALVRALIETSLHYSPMMDLIGGKAAVAVDITITEEFHYA